MTPARGKLFVRKIETPETAPHGKILLTEATRKELTAQQAEIVGAGLPLDCYEDACERPHISLMTRRFHRPDPLLQLGSWVLLAPRSLVETDEPGLYVVSQDDVLAVLEA